MNDIRQVEAARRGERLLSTQRVVPRINAVRHEFA
jgi:hypothetical protein